MKQPVLEHLPKKPKESFFIQQFDLSNFSTPWHYHPEHELVLIEESYGTRFIGNTVSEFSKGNLSFIGRNLPHIYNNPPEYYQNNQSLRAKSIVIHFSESLFDDFLQLPEALKIKSFLIQSTFGFDIYGRTKSKIISNMRKILKSEGFTRILLLLDILNELASSSELEYISETKMVGYNHLDSDRLSLVFQHILSNFSKEIKLEDMASLLFMTRTSFCRYFKERTKRTFSDFLIDIRLNHAAQLLVEQNENIIAIAMECGYNNTTNFNRQFKRKYKVTPIVYRTLKKKQLLMNVL